MRQKRGCADRIRKSSKVCLVASIRNGALLNSIGGAVTLIARARCSANAARETAKESERWEKALRPNVLCHVHAQRPRREEKGAPRTPARALRDQRVHLAGGEGTRVKRMVHDEDEGTLAYLHSPQSGCADVAMFRCQLLLLSAFDARSLCPGGLGVDQPLFFWGPDSQRLSTRDY